DGGPRSDRWTTDTPTPSARSTRQTGAPPRAGQPSACRVARPASRPGGHGRFLSCDGSRGVAPCLPPGAEAGDPVTRHPHPPPDVRRGEPELAPFGKRVPPPQE